MSLVLIVEDEPDMRFLLRLTLERGEVEVADAESAEQALELMADRAPDVVVLDVNLPGMDGFELIDRMRLSETLADVPVVMLTADARPQVAETAERKGCFEFLSKPIPPEALVASVAAAIASRSDNEGAESTPKP
jgi:CheY-like chemotaxis protein